MPDPSSTSDSTSERPRAASHRRHRRSRSGSKRSSRRRVADPLKAWLAVADGLLTGLEETVWQLREIGERTIEAVDDTRESLEGLADQSRGLGEQASKIPQKLARLTSTGWVMAQILASYRFLPFRLAFLSRRSGEALRQRVHARNAERVRDLCERQGGALLKVGQILSARPDLMPQVWCETLQTLQDDAPPVAFPLIRQVLEEELGKDLDAIFEHFEETPVAAASIGQVHRARLKDGREVAVKVQRPGIQELVRLDMELLAMFIEASKDSLPRVDFDTIVAETREMIEAELDYRREAAMTESVADMFADHPSIHVPRTVPQYSTERVLMTEWMQGEKISRVLERWYTDQEGGCEVAQDRIGAALGMTMQAYFVQILEHGLFQADPHPGNLLLRENGELVLLDFGCAKAIEDSARIAYLKLVQAFLIKDHPGIAVLLQEIGLRTESGTLESLERYTTLILQEFDKARDEGGWPAQAQVIATATAVLGELEDDPVVKLPVDFVMLGRVFGTLGGLFLQYQPRIDFLRDLMPVMQRLAVASQTVREAEQQAGDDPQ